MLRLQRTIGNRATVRLLQRDTLEEERAEFEQLKHVGHPTQEPAPHYMHGAGLTPESKVRSRTPLDIQAVIAESRVLRPYLRGKDAINKHGFEIHPAPERDFNRSFADYENVSGTDSELEARYGQVGGYYDRVKHVIHVRYRSTFGQALHEAMHELSSNGFRPTWGTDLNEGVTQYFADRVLEEQGMHKDTSHSYGNELACAERLVAATSPDMVARAYFREDPELREAIMRRLGLDLAALQREARANTLCTRLPSR